MAEITDEMVTRALAVIMTPPGLRYFDDPFSVAENRGVVARALLAALQDDATARHASCSCTRLVTIPTLDEARTHPVTR